MSQQEKGTALAVKEDAIDFKVKFAKSELKLIRDHLAPNADSGEFALFIYDAQKRGLNPLSKQIYFVKYQGKPSHQVSIDGYRALAESTGKYDGSSEIEFGDMVHYKNTDLVVPEWAKITVFKKGAQHGFPAKIYFDEFVQTYRNKQTGKMEVGAQWAQRPRHMLAKCVEALALRKAFPEQLGGTYTADEFSGAEEPSVNVRDNTIEGDVDAVEPPAPEAPKKAFFEEPGTIINPPRQGVIREVQQELTPAEQEKIEDSGMHGMVDPSEMRAPSQPNF